MIMEGIIARNYIHNSLQTGLGLISPVHDNVKWPAQLTIFIPWWILPRALRHRARSPVGGAEGGALSDSLPAIRRHTPHSARYTLQRRTLTIETLL